jgi:hypothetical protein
MVDLSMTNDDMLELKHQTMGLNWINQWIIDTMGIWEDHGDLWAGRRADI